MESFGNEEIYLFLDYYLAGENGLALLPEINRLNKQAKIIFVTGAVSPLVIRTLSQYGPDGILSKSCGIDNLVNCIEAIKNGNKFIDPFFQKLIEDMPKPVRFTAREIELLKLFAEGASIAETAKKTFLSPHTVVAHRRKMMAKANCQSITQMLHFAKEHELI
ncbi:response regulator transcription factor [Sphingobacterium sp. InxBP1]|uniref:response regulator transcription factor n=1 Tax=Sphingobacterium sp. InxBP1 TaxID=2870328 RepID=UPI002242DB0E|nr:response regulator transcription factor [Sphingobacterium sp. InxBP1]MCW8310788.1 response regulator transcription factor [Sphingobacterium sp. InxBP1]